MKRYDMGCSSVGEIIPYEDTDGEWVRYEDHQKVKAELVEAAEEYQVAVEINPSCQFGVIKKCYCKLCSKKRLDTALARARAKG